MFFVITILAIFIICVLLFISRVVLWLCVLGIRRWTKLDIKITNYQQLLLGYLSMSLKKSTLVLELQNCHISSSIVNRKYRKLIVVCIGEIRISFDALETNRKSSVKQGDSVKHKNTILQKLSKYLKITKVVGVDIGSISSTLMNVLDNDINCQLLTNSVASDFSHSTRDAALSTSFEVSSLRILCSRNNEEDSDVNGDNLFEFLINLSLNVQVDSSNLSKIKKLIWRVDRLRASCSQDFISLVISQYHTRRKKGIQSSEVRKQISLFDKLHLVPEEIDVKLCSLEVALRKSETQRGLILGCSVIKLYSSHSVHDIRKKSLSLEASNKCIVKGFYVKEKSDIFSTTLLQLCIKISERQLNVELCLNDARTNLSSIEVVQWCQTLRRLRSTDKASTDDSVPDSCKYPKELNKAKLGSKDYTPDGDSVTKNSLRFFDIVGERILKVNVAVNHVKIYLLGAGSMGGIEVGLSVFKLTITTSSIGESSVLACRDTQADIELVALYCRHILGRAKSLTFPDGEFPTDRHHYWGVVMYAGLLALRIAKLSRQSSCDLIIDSVQSELSPALFATLDMLLSTLHSCLDIIKSSNLVTNKSISLSYSAILEDPVHNCATKSGFSQISSASLEVDQVPKQIAKSQLSSLEQNSNKDFIDIQNQALQISATKQSKICNSLDISERDISAKIEKTVEVDNIEPDLSQDFNDQHERNSTFIAASPFAGGASRSKMEKKSVVDDAMEELEDSTIRLNDWLNDIPVKVQCTNMNIYALCENKALTTLRCDSLLLRRVEDLISVTLTDTKVIYGLKQESAKSQPIQRSVEINKPLTHIKTLRLEHNQKNQVLSVRTLEQAVIGWSIPLHMCLDVLVRLGVETSKKYKTVHSQLSSKKKPAKGSKEEQRNLSISLLCVPGLTVNIITSRQHVISFEASELTIEKSADSQKYFRCTSLNISCDQQAIFHIEEARIYSEYGSERFCTERINQSPLLDAVNRAWIIDMYLFNIVFPFDFNFAECFDDFKLINKWRKIIYKKEKKPFTVDSPLYADILIKIKTASLQLSDDPFEVKLGDLYALRCDENLENDKRLSAMDKRLQDLRKKHTVLPVEKVDSLYESLSRKSTEVYIQRAQQLYVAAPMRSALFTWSLEGLEIMALADRSYNGRENVMKHMKDIDNASPLPDNIEFVSLFCRMINASAVSWTFRMRDFPQPMLHIVDLHVWGRLIGSEQVGIPRAKRRTEIDQGEPWGKIVAERNMPSMKFYHDFSADIQSFDMAYGPCWEPTMAQMNLAMNKINRSSVDPSRALPFWDKFRLMLHGRLTASIERSTWLYHASLDPYNTTEFMDWTWDQLVLDWTEGKWILQGNLDIYSKTASKYDDCRLIHLPGLRLSLLLDWLCTGDPHDHHAVMPCAPDKKPTLIDKEYDSYELFRSLGFNISLSFETIGSVADDADSSDSIPSCLLYASTLRWMDRLKMVMNRVSRPIRRGRLFGRVVPRKQQFMKSIRNLKVLLNVPRFKLQYWVSFSTQLGAELLSDQLKLDVDLVSTITRANQNQDLIRRPALVWSIKRFDSLLSCFNVWLCSCRESHKQERQLSKAATEKAFLLSVDKVSYQRQEEKVPDDTSLDTEILTADDELSEEYDESPVHKLTVRDLKGSWTPANRNIALSLYDGYVKSQMLKKNLSANALKGFRVETDTKTGGNRRSSIQGSGNNSPGYLLSPRQRIQSGPVQNLLEKLVSESGSKFVAIHEELSGGVIQTEQLHGVTACQTADVLHKNWLIELHNSQVMLRGVETSGYLIVCASRASLVCHDHSPKWNYHQQLNSKTSLVASVEGMQYYATVDAGSSRRDDDIQWLLKDNIRDQAWDLDSTTSTMESGRGLDMGLVGLADMVGCGQSVGGVVNDSQSTNNKSPGSTQQLQRIISRCRCQIFCAWYGEVRSETLAEIPAPPPEDETDMMSRKEEVDVFTLLHHDLKICTNSLQYATVLDIVNNLLLYVEPKKKELTEKLQNMRFKLQLASDKDQKSPIQQRQNHLRDLVEKVRRLERELYLMQRVGTDDEVFSDDTFQQSVELTKSLEDTKDQLNALSEELSIMISCYRERQLQITSQRHSGTTRNQRDPPMVRRNEVYFRQAEWRMTDTDGQIGIADLLLENFLYTKINRENDCGSHHLELGWFRVTNLLPNSIYTDVLMPENRPGKGFSDRMTALRVICKFSSPVGGISVREHFEVNVVPLAIQMTARFYTQVMAFFFPNKKEDSDDDLDVEDGIQFDETDSIASGISLASAGSGINDIDRMKERAAKNNMFAYIKIPEVPLRVSYKSDKEKNILNIHDFHFLLRTLEYHNQTWTWHDLAMAIKSDCKKVIIGQAVQQKLRIKSRSFLPIFQTHEGTDKAKLLMGPKLMGPKDKDKDKTLGRKNHD